MQEKLEMKCQDTWRVHVQEIRLKERPSSMQSHWQSETSQEAQILCLLFV